jgi:hypothetical protein
MFENAAKFERPDLTLPVSALTRVCC